MTIDHAALDSLSPLSPDELYRQWVIAPQGHNGPTEWREFSFDGWQLFAHTDAHVCELTSTDGYTVGWVMEAMAYLKEEDGNVPKEKQVLPVGKNFSASEIERALYGRDSSGYSDGTGFTGTWTAIIFGGRGDSTFQRVYLGVSHSVVYSLQQQVVATTHNLIPDIQRDEDLSKAFDCLNRRSYFSFGLTAFKGLSRLLPNHYLDLKTFQSKRHWPISSLDRYTNGKKGAANLVDYCRRIVNVITSEYPKSRVFLSAGRDSRAILACLRPFVENDEDITLSTTVSSSLASKIDLQAARWLARRTGLPHKVKRKKSRSEMSDDYVMRSFVRIGEAAAAPNLFASPDIHNRKPFNPNARFKIAGMGGETGRAKFWSQGLPKEDITPEFIMEKVKAPLTNVVKKAAGNWLKSVPRDFRTRKADLLDLVYIEQRIGCWKAPMTYLFAGMENPGRLSRLNTSPMAEVLSYEIMLRLPEEYRAAATLQKDMVAYGWPELLYNIPFNEPRGLLRVKKILGNFVRNPRKIAGVFRRIWQ